MALAFILTGCLLLAPPLFVADENRLKAFAVAYQKRSEARQNAEDYLKTLNGMIEMAYAVRLSRLGWDEAMDEFEFLNLIAEKLKEVPGKIAASRLGQEAKRGMFMDYDVYGLRVKARQEMLWARFEEIVTERRSEARMRESAA